MKRALLTVSLIVVARAAGAQPYDLSWSTVDGGGMTNGTGGAYTLSSTTGQPDAGGPFAGSPYTLHSGFWALIASGGGGPQADLSITKSNGVAASIPGASTSYTIVAGNAGPAATTGATVSDTTPASLTGVSWTCSASPGSSCPASGSGAINTAVNLLVGGNATFVLTGTIAPNATGTLANTASIAVPAGVTDPNGVNNAATDTDSLTPQADLSVTIADSPDPVPAGSNLTYAIQAANAGPSTSTSATITHTLPSPASFVSASPGCVPAGGVVTCTLGTLAPAAGTSLTVVVAVSPSAVSALVSSVSIDGPAADPNTANDFDAETTAVTVARADAEIVHGTRLIADLAASGGLADLDTFRISQKPYASYEVVLDAASGDVGLATGPALERISASGTTVLQTSVPVGAGFARSLRFRNDTSTAIDDQRIRVRSLGCSTNCGSDDVYRLRGWETTAAIARFNNSATQITVVILQNRGPAPIAGRVYFWSTAGALLHQEPLGLAGWGSVSVNTSAISALAGQGGSLTVAHDGPFGALAGKAVALEPASGLSFDSMLELRLR